MNSNASSSSSAHSNSSALPAFVPAFYASSYGDELDDDELEFSPERIHSANTSSGKLFAADAAAPATMSAPPTFSYATAASAHHTPALALDDDDDDALFVPKTTYRDTHHVFANGPCDLVFHSDSYLESSVFSHAGKAPTFVLESATTKKSSLHLPLATASPLSPSSYSDKIDVPQKESASYFCVNPVMPSRAAPSAIMAALEAALRQFDCEFEIVQQWSIRASLLCVAEEIAFTLALARVGTDSYEVDFLHRSGDETKFVLLAEHIRSLCVDVDDDALPLCLHEPLDPWVDASQELTSRRHAMKEKDVRDLIETLTKSDLHPDTAYDIAKTLKDHCRLKQNRKLFLQSNHAGVLESLKWMLADSDECARFGVFILSHFAKDCESGSADASSAFFQTPFDKSAFALLLDDVQSRLRDAPCGKYTLAEVERLQQSALFC